MKKLLLLLFAATLFVSCSSDDDEPTQDYTSFTIKTQGIMIYNCKAGFYDSNNNFVEVANVGDVIQDTTTEEFIVNDTVTQFYLYGLIDPFYVFRLKNPIILKKNEKNNIFIPYPLEFIIIDNVP